MTRKSFAAISNMDDSELDDMDQDSSNEPFGSGRKEKLATEFIKRPEKKDAQERLLDPSQFNTVNASEIGSEPSLIHSRRR